MKEQFRREPHVAVVVFVLFMIAGMLQEDLFQEIWVLELFNCFKTRVAR
jgi:hypothetical protein